MGFSSCGSWLSSLCSRGRLSSPAHPPGISALTGFHVLLVEVLLAGLYHCHFQVLEMHRDSSFHPSCGQSQSQPLGVKLVLVVLEDVLWRLCEKP